MRIRKNKETFEGVSGRVHNTQSRIHELLHKIEQEKVKLAEELALLEQYKVIVEVTTRSSKDEFGVKPQFGWQA
jgi:hypothetical protein